MPISWLCWSPSVTAPKRLDELDPDLTKLVRGDRETLRGLTATLEQADKNRCLQLADSFLERVAAGQSGFVTFRVPFTDIEFGSIRLPKLLDQLGVPKINEAVDIPTLSKAVSGLSDVSRPVAAGPRALRGFPGGFVKALDETGDFGAALKRFEPEFQKSFTTTTAAVKALDDAKRAAVTQAATALGVPEKEAGSSVHDVLGYVRRVVREDRPAQAHVLDELRGKLVRRKAIRVPGKQQHLASRHSCEGFGKRGEAAIHAQAFPHGRHGFAREIGSVIEEPPHFVLAQPVLSLTGLLAVTLPLISRLVPHFGEDPEDLATTLFEVAPTVLFTVPRYLQKFASQVLVGMLNSSSLKRGTYQTAMRFAREHARRRWDFHGAVVAIRLPAHEQQVAVLSGPAILPAFHMD